MPKIILIEYLPNGRTRSHEVTRESFLQVVDKIRRKKHGWQLFLNGKVTTEKQAFKEFGLLWYLCRWCIS